MKLETAAGLILVLSATVASATDPAPLALYQAGKYEDAIKAGAAQNNAEGYTVAARAELAKEMMRDTPCLSCLQQAEAYARKAIAVDPKRPECRVYLAATLGYESRIIGTIAARFKGYADDAKTNIDAALTSQPGDAWALAALGGWHFAVVEGGGRLLASMTYGASVDKGRKAFDAAIAADPGNIVIRFQYVLSLSSYDREAYANEIEGALQAAVNGQPKTAYDAFTQGHARTLLDTMKRGDWKTYDALVRHYQGYPA